MRIVNIYDQRHMQSGEGLVRKLNWQKVIRQGGMFLAESSNPHTSQSDPKCQVQPNAKFLEEVIDQNRLESGHDGSVTHHRRRERHEGEAFIDLMLAK